MQPKGIAEGKVTQPFCLEMGQLLKLHELADRTRRSGRIRNVDRNQVTPRARIKIQKLRRFQGTGRSRYPGAVAKDVKEA